MNEIKPKFFKFKNIIKHKYIRHQNLFEMLSIYPNKGMEFFVKKAYWKKNKYFKIINSVSKGHAYRYGVMTGVFYEDNIRVKNKKPIIIEDYTNRGLWRYEINNFNVKLENGMEYNQKDIIDFYNKQKERNNGFFTKEKIEIIKLE